MIGNLHLQVFFHIVDEPLLWFLAPAEVTICYNVQYNTLCVVDTAAPCNLKWLFAASLVDG